MKTSKSVIIRQECHKVKATILLFLTRRKPKLPPSLVLLWLSRVFSTSPSLMTVLWQTRNKNVADIKRFSRDSCFGVNIHQCVLTWYCRKRTMPRQETDSTFKDFLHQWCVLLDSEFRRSLSMMCTNKCPIRRSLSKMYANICFFKKFSVYWQMSFSDVPYQWCLLIDSVFRGSLSMAFTNWFHFQTIPNNGVCL